MKCDSQLHYLYVLILVLFSGTPILDNYLPEEITLVLWAGYLSVVLLRNSNYKLTIHNNVIFCAYVAIIIVHSIGLSFFPIKTILGFFTRLIIGYATIRIVDNFPQRFIKVMYWLSVLSIIFWFMGLTGIVNPLLMKIGPYFTREYGGASGYNILLHNYHVSHGFELSIRNCGVFREPGWLAGYTSLALVFLILNRSLFTLREYKRYVILIGFTLLTTMSTMGYICLTLILFLLYYCKDQVYYYRHSRLFFGLFIILPFIVMLSYIAYNKLPFLGNKIEEQLFRVEMRSANWERSRFGTLLFDWEYIKKRPIFGWGLNDITRFSLNPEMIGEHRGMGNGMSDFTVKFGIIGMSIWLVCIFHSLLNISQNKWGIALFGLLIICLVLQDEPFLKYPLFLGIMFCNQKNNCINKAFMNQSPCRLGVFKIRYQQDKMAI